jgi:diguanylate cyclase (GGDEF)-like protein/PAS domain S-box-containing protein
MHVLDGPGTEEQVKRGDGGGGGGDRAARAGLIAVFAYAAIYLAWAGIRVWGAQWVQPGVVATVTGLEFVPFNIGLLALAWVAARRSPDLDIRRSLGWVAVATGGVLVGNLVGYVVQATGGNPSASAVTNVPYLLWYPATLMALLELPRAPRANSERGKFLFDASAAVLGGGLAIWYIVFYPSAAFAAPHPNRFEAFFDVAYPIGDIVVLVGLITVLLRSPDAAAPRRSLKMFMAGLVIYVVSDVANDRLDAQFGWNSLAWPDLLFVGAYLLMVSACYRFVTDPPPPAQQKDQSTVQPFSLLPYASLVLCYGLLLIESIEHRRERWAELAVGSILLTLLIVVRQMRAVRENAGLVAERATRVNEARFRSLIQHSSDVITIIDPQSVVRFVSPSVSRVLGYTPAELEGRPLMEILHPDDVARALEVLSKAGRPAPGAPTDPHEWRVRHRDGRWLEVESVGTNLTDEPTVAGIVVNTRDVSERKLLEQQLTYQAFHDPLTGLSNRSLFLDRVTQALYRLRRRGESAAPLAVLFLDLDNFKTINDSLGHLAGDRLLIAAAVRIVGCVRTSDTVARLGGDEFAVLIEESAGDASAAVVADRITHALRESFTLEGKEVVVTASVGIATAREAGPSATASDLLRNADMAMYTAKSRGKGRHETFETHMHREVMNRLELEGDLRRAVERRNGAGEFALVYQPIVDLRSGAVSGVEALIRWHHPRRGLMYPSQFIPLAEETGLIVSLGAWVLREACRQAREWDARSVEGSSALTLTVNLSGHQLQHPGIVELVHESLAESGLAGDRLVLEITESVLMQQTDLMLQRLRALKTVGVRLAIDDFGTGYSSLSYLQRFPIDILKIAKPFVDDVGIPSTDPALARAIIALGETLCLRTIAEGIEAAEQLAGLRALGCELGQGYYLSRPVSGAAMAELLAGSVLAR